MEYVGTAGGKKPAMQAAEPMGKSPPLVKEDAMKPIFRVNKPPWAQFAGRAYNKAVSPSLLSFLLDFAFFHIDLRRAIELLSELPGVFLNNSLGHVQQKH